jgi:glycosyltransferase involved in cell wall biosynthesis
MWESFGLPLVEAMASGTPVIASSAKALPEVGGDAALYVAPGDVPGLSSAIALVLADPELHAELRRRGLQRSSEYSWERTAGQTVDVYRAIARDGRLS